MPVKIYVGQDIQKFTHFPDKSHEARGVRQICEYLWDIWHHGSSRHYAIVANPKRTHTGRELSADLVLISELGIGVVELKGSYNEIDCGKPNSAWYAGPARIKSGALPFAEGGYRNPHKQVQAYAAAIRDDLIESLAMPGGPEEWEQFKFQTAVCFTNPRAEIETCQDAVGELWWRKKELAEWEEFSVMAPKDMREWGADLRFDMDMGAAYGYRSYAWSPEQVHRLATEFFGARVWLEMNHSMTPDAPFAFLSLKKHDRTMRIYGVSHEVATVGRANESHVFISGEYPNVSRNHAVITRELKGFTIEDVSSNGTYLQGKRLVKFRKYPLQEGDVIMLGGNGNGTKACTLEFSRHAPPPLSTAFNNLRTLD